MSYLIDCKLISDNIINNIKKEYNEINLKKINKKPTIAIIQINDKEETSIYIQSKIKILDNLDFNYFIYKYNTSITNEDVIDLITRINNNNDIHGIFLNFPLPCHLNQESIINSID